MVVARLLAYAPTLALFHRQKQQKETLIEAAPSSLPSNAILMITAKIVLPKNLKPEFRNGSFFSGQQHGRCSFQASLEELIRLMIDIYNVNSGAKYKAFEYFKPK